MRLWFVMGTAAELIKVYPLIDWAQRHQMEWFVLSTGQSGVNFWKQYEDFDLPKNRSATLVKSESDLERSGAAIKWFSRSLLTLGPRLKKQLRSTIGTTPEKGDYWFVHGDTLSTLIGAVYGKTLGVKVVHLEAGMRSHNLLSPFPEEFSRKLVSRLSSYHLVQDENAAKNLRDEGFKRNIILTQQNTIIDTLQITLQKKKPQNIPGGDYVVANLHRFENLNSAIRWKIMVDVLLRVSKQIPVYLVLHPQTKYKLESDPKLKNDLLKAGVVLIDRLPFSQFIHLMFHSKFVISDGGSNQEECFYLGKPCLILRDRTERVEGLGSTCVLSEFKVDVIEEFLKNPMNHKGRTIVPEKRPTDIIFENLFAEKKLTP